MTEPVAPVQDSGATAKTTPNPKIQLNETSVPSDHFQCGKPARNFLPAAGAPIHFQQSAALDCRDRSPRSHHHARLRLRQLSLWRQVAGQSVGSPARRSIVQKHTVEVPLCQGQDSVWSRLDPIRSALMFKAARRALV